MVLFHGLMNNFHDFIGEGVLFSDLKGVFTYSKSAEAVQIYSL
jgi:hypothetical protein